jgi:hypothetical protein
VKKVIGKIKNGALSSGLVTWMCYIDLLDEHERKMELMTMIVANFVKRETSKGFRKWYSVAIGNVEKERRAMKIVRKIIMKTLNMKVWRAVSAWKSYVSLHKDWEQEVKRSLAVMKNTLGRMQNKLLFQGFKGWTKYIDGCKKALAQKEADRKLLNKIISVMLNRYMHAAFSQWCKETENARTIEQKMEKVILRMTNAKTFAALSHFKATVDLLAHEECVMSKTIRRMTNAVTSAGFSTWTHVTTALRNEEVRKEDLMVKTMQRIQKAALYGGWNAWASAIRAMIHFEEAKIYWDRASAMTKVIAAFGKAGLFKGWSTWVHHFRAMAEAERQRQMPVMTMIVGRLTRRHLWNGINSWKTYVAHKIHFQFQERRRCAYKIIDKAGTVKSGSAFSKWIQFVCFAVHKEVLLKLLLRQILRATLAKGFARWVHHSDAVWHQKHQVSIIVKCLTRKNLDRGFRKWLGAATSIAESQRLGLKNQKHHLQLIFKMANHSNYLVMLRAFWCWQKYTHLVKGRMCHVLSKMVLCKSSASRSRYAVHRHFFRWKNVASRAMFSRREILIKNQMFTSQRAFEALKRYSTQTERRFSLAVICSIFHEMGVWRRKMVSCYFGKWKSAWISPSVILRHPSSLDASQTLVGRFRELHAQHRAILQVNTSLNGEVARLKKAVVKRNVLLEHADITFLADDSQHHARSDLNYSNFENSQDSTGQRPCGVSDLANCL